jgi:hypothetical protein
MKYFIDPVTVAKVQLISKSDVDKVFICLNETFPTAANVSSLAHRSGQVSEEFVWIRKGRLRFQTKETGHGCSYNQYVIIESFGFNY